MMRFLPIIIFLMGSSSFADVKFESGNQFEAWFLAGNIDITCYENGRREYRNHTCRQWRLEPAEFVYLVSDTEIDANKVKLTSTWEDGSVEVKKIGYDSGKSTSRNRVNLWIDTLLQNPLLDFGENNIDYEFSNGSDIVASGSFKANVDKKSKRRCQYRSYTSNSLSDCRFPERMCNRYFWELNDCK